MKKKNLIFVVNFHPTASFESLAIPVQNPGKYEIVLDSDLLDYGGYNRIKPGCEYFSQRDTPYDGSNGILIYLPSRSALVFKRVTK